MNEKCAVVGAHDPNAAIEAALALKVMENRGSVATGIGGITDEGKFCLIRESGAAGDIWNEQRMAQIATWGLVAATGHDRYATSGKVDRHHQPVKRGMGDQQLLLSHNGNLSDTRDLAFDSIVRGIDVEGINDSELMTSAIAVRVEQGASVPDAVADVYPLLTGAFSVVIVSKNEYGEPVLTAFRDRHGVRPLALGRTAGGLMVASETMGLEAAGAEFIRDIEPGEMISITADEFEKRHLAEPDPKFDMFELIYFSRPDSKFKNVLIADIRKEMGRQLAREMGDMVPDNALVVGVPATAVPFGLGFAEQRGLKYAQVIEKNPDVGRTFMAPTQASREALRDKKYIFKGDQIRNRDIVVVDDSIVRRTTAKFITNKLLSHGAKSVSFFSGSPPIRFPNFYGIDTPEQGKLIAANYGIDKIRRDINATRLGFLSLEGMTQAVYNMTGEPPDNFEVSCFTGIYPIGVDPSYLAQIQQPASMQFIA